MKNVCYVGLKTGLIKTCSHAAFDEACYCAATHPPAAQLLYDLGLVDDVEVADTARSRAPYPPCPGTHGAPLAVPLAAKMEILLLRFGTEPKGMERHMRLSVGSASPQGKK